MQANLKTEQRPQDWKRSVFTPIPKKGKARECSNYCTISLISHACKVMLKILQPRLQQYVKCELSDVQAEFRKDKNQRLNCQHPLCHQENKESSRKKKSTFASLTVLKSLTAEITINCGKFLKKWEHQTIPIS